MKPNPKKAAQVMVKYHKSVAKALEINRRAIKLACSARDMEAVSVLQSVQRELEILKDNTVSKKREAV